MIDNRLSYCKVCKLNEFNTRIGTICGLTKQKPSFALNCQNYDYSESEHRKQINDIKSHLEKWTDSEDTAQNLINNRLIEYKVIESLSNDKYNLRNIPLKFEIFESRFFYIWFWIIPSIVSSVLLFRQIINPYDYRLTTNTFGYSLIAIFIGTILYAFYKITINRSPVLRLDNKGICINQREDIEWRDIILCAIKSDKERGLSSDSLLIFRFSTHSETSVEIKRLTETSIRIAHLIRLYQRKYCDYKK